MPRDRFPHRVPPWWPEQAEWPPTGLANQPHWREMRGRFLRRVGCGFVLLLLVLVLSSTALSWLIASATGVGHFTGGAAWLLRGAVLLIVMGGVVGIATAGRALHGAAMPVGDLLEAAGRVADGDYSARVAERGPGEVQALAHAFNSMAAKLQANDEQRRSLLADVTHELRTPITVIQGNLEGVLDGIYPANPERIQSILEETRTLSRVIDDLRTLSLAESGALKLQLESADLGELAADLAASFGAQASAAGIGLSVEAQPDLPAAIIDPTRIREVLSNLLVNALRYTPAGGRVQLRCWVQEEDLRHIRVSVSDTGAGISAEDLPHIFDRFHKSTDSRGTGLGLAISKSLVSAHGGEISISSASDRGTTVCFTLPISPVRAESS